MGYYLKVFAKSDATIPVSWFRTGYDQLGCDVVLECDPGMEDCWRSITVKHGDGRQICFVERNVVAPGSIAAQTVEGYLNDLSYYRPRSGVEWVGEFLHVCGWSTG